MSMLAPHPVRICAETRTNMAVKIKRGPATWPEVPMGLSPQLTSLSGLFPVHPWAFFSLESFLKLSALIGRYVVFYSLPSLPV